MGDKNISVLVCEPIAQEGLNLFHNYPEFTVDVCLGLSKDSLLEKVHNYDAVLVRSQTKVNKELIDAASSLKVIGRAGVGTDNIDISWAKQKGITVFNTPWANSISTAEHAFALILGLVRKIPFAHNHVREGSWQRSEFKGTELYKKNIGIIGFGNVGKELSIRAKAFGMNVLTSDPVLSDELAREFKANLVELEELLNKSDIISLHCPLNEQTKNIINQSTINQMKQGVFLINSARGELLNEEDLLDALNLGKVSGVALDVFSIEPPSKNILLNHPKVITTPHIAASTKEAQLRVSTALVEQVLEFFKQRNLQ